MAPQRYEDISEKLGFAYLKLRILSDELHEARVGDRDITFLGQKAGEILSACRECFDYCARDLVDTFLTAPPRQAYFPFTIESLKKVPWLSIKTADQSTYRYLEELAEKIDANVMLSGTIFSYRRIRDVNSLVNAKKHDRITKVDRPDNASTLIDFGNGQTMLMSPVFSFDENGPDFGAQSQAEPMVGNHPGIQIKYVSEYHLADNNWEVGRYCEHAIQTSWRILDDLYATVFGCERSALDPAETTKPKEQKEFEALVRRASPIVTRLGRVALFNGDKELARVEITFDGIVSPDDPDSAFMADYFRDAFYAHGRNVIGPQFDAALKNGGLARAESDGFQPRYMEMTISVTNGVSLILPTGRTLSFDRTVWGLLTKFQNKEVENFHPSGDAMKRAAVLFGLTIRTAVGANPLGFGH